MRENKNERKKKHHIEALAAKVPFNFVTLHLNFYFRYYFANVAGAQWLLVSITIQLVHLRKWFFR